MPAIKIIDRRDIVNNPKEKILIEDVTSLNSGYEEIVKTLSKAIKAQPKKVVGIECYPTTNEELLLKKIIEPLQPDCIFNSNDIFLPAEKVTEIIAANLTDDRVFGLMSHHKFEDFIDEEKFIQQKKLIAGKRVENKLVVIYGVGASLFESIDILVYSDLTRWEVQNRYKSKEYSNWKAENTGEDPLKMIKRGYYFEWNIADRQKKRKFSTIDFLLDLHRENDPKMISQPDYLKALSKVVSQPFSLVPFYEPGIWGGTWMQEKFSIGQDEKNLAWCFNGVPEENSLLLEIENQLFETPATNLVLLKPKELLGDKVQGRFGKKFPIRFNLLDTIDGENLSLQVHPKVDYIQDVFGATYTQDESYYILEAKNDAVVYLGVKSGVEKKDLMNALEKASQGKETFDDEKYIFRQKMNKHDHYSIPSGTIHSSGKDSVVLEISATPNRFTFKLWDWGRVDFDGMPRPVHLEHGKENIDIFKDQNWVTQELINPFVKLVEEDGYLEEKTGLHETEFIETRRHTLEKSKLVKNHNSVNVLCVVEGEGIIISCPTMSFKPFKVDYCQVVIVPEQITEYIIEPIKNSQTKSVKLVQAFVK